MITNARIITPPLILSTFSKIKQYVVAFISLLRNEVARLAIRHDASVFIKGLQKQGVDIADDVIVFGENIRIDLTRPSLIHIGEKTFLHNGLKILTHDYATFCFLNKFQDFVPSSGEVFIGNNVWFGENVTILRGSYIGDNCIIGINSVVMGRIPDNTVAAGCPAKVVCSLDEYYEKRKKQCVEEAFAYARSLKKRFNRKPVPADFWEEFPLFVSGGEVEKYPDLPIRKQLGDAFDSWSRNHKAPYSSFEEFLRHAGIE